MLSLVTLVLCCAVVGLTFLFQRELKRRTKAETKLRRIARTDDLTGLPNRRAFRETFEREWRQAVACAAAFGRWRIRIALPNGSRRPQSTP